MPHAFVHLCPELADAVTRSLVLTTNERLRRNLVRAFNDAQLAAGRTVWPTPRVQTMTGYLGSLYHDRRATAPDLPILLGVESEYQLFRSTAPEGARGPGASGSAGLESLPSVGNPRRPPASD